MPIPNLLTKYGIEPEAKTTGVPNLIATKYKNFSEPEPAPLPAKPGILSRIGTGIKTGLNKASDFLAGAAEAPTYTTGSKMEIARNLPGEIVRTILPGAAALQDNPELAAEISNKDILKEVPKAVGETIVAPALSFPLTFYGATSKYVNPKLGLPMAPGTNETGAVKIKTPIGDITNVQARIEEQEVPETKLATVAEVAKHTGFELLNGLFTASMASKAVNPRVRTLTPKGTVKTPLAGEPGPKTGQLYQPQIYKYRVSPEAFDKIVAENEIGVRTNYNPKNPIFFQASEIGPNGAGKGQFFQIRPSYMDEFLNVFKGDPTNVPRTEIIPIADVSKPVITETKPPIVPPATVVTPPAPTQPMVQPKPNVTPVTSQPPKLTIQPAPKPAVPGFAEIRKEPTVVPDQLVTKIQVKEMLQGLGEKSVNFTVVEENGTKYMTYKDPFKEGGANLKLRPSALGLSETNIVPGQTININAKDLAKPGPTMRGVTEEGGVEASLKDDLSNPKLPATTPADFVKRIEQLNKFGQSQAILRRTGGVPKKASGIFRHGKKAPTKGIVQLQDMTVKQQSQYMSTLSHELGHALDFNVNGKQMNKTLDIFGKDLTAEQRKTIHNELKAVTDNLVGKEIASKGSGYYYSNVELFARFLQSMFVKPGEIGNLAPTAVDLFGKAAIENPIIAEYLDAVNGAIDLGERKHIFLRDMKQTYIKHLGTRAGTAAWNNEMRYRSMKSRATTLIEKLIKDKFKGVDDDPELLFRSAESIKVTKDGVPEFGTRDFQYAKSEKEMEALKNNGYIPLKNEAGTPLIEYIDGEPYVRLARQRYTPEQGKALYDQLSPKGKALINDFTAAKEDAKDYFNREVIKDVNKINTNIEGWVHHYWEDKPIGPGGKRLQTKIASAKKQREGAEGYVEDLQKAMQKAITEIETEKAYNAFIEDFFAQVTEPIAKGEDPKTGYVEVTGDIKKGGVGTKQEMRTVVITKGKAVPAQRPRYQMPKEIYERFQKIKEVADEASTAMRIVNNLNRYWRVNILFHMGSAATNFISGGIQYSAKVLTDFYTEALTGSIAFEKTRRDLYSMLTVLTPKGWQNAPDWVYGGDMSNFYGEFMGEKAPGLKVLEKSVDAYADKALKIYGSVERYWKKVIATTEKVSDLKNLNMVTKEGLKLPTDMENEILDYVNSEIDLFAYDYDNVPNWLQNYQKNPGWQSIKPFAKYPYKYSKQVTEMIGAAFDGTLPWQERVAKILALSTLIAIYAYIRNERQKKSKTPTVPEEAPASVDTRGRLYVGTDEKGNELFTRTAKYPFINLTEAGAQFIEGNNKEGLNILNDMLGSLAPAGTLAAAAMGYRNEYQQYTPFGVIAGQSAASFVPGTRILSDIARFFDPYQRKQTTFLQGFTSFYPTTNPDLQKKLRGEIRTIQVPLEGGVMPNVGEGTRRTTTDMYVRNYKNDILLGLLGGIYINRIDPDVAEAFVTRKEENEAKEAKKGVTNKFYTQ